MSREVAVQMMRRLQISRGNSRSWPVATAAILKSLRHDDRLETHISVLLVGTIW